ncbi:MAG TPA: putative lipid II flippase FtsW [Candidatus Nanopelagicales bacterium]|jgi:cell division protein FtsW|nr:putative lipid II flippase FtsW [Candidatus Nanopelagicales bacterium]
MSADAPADTSAELRRPARLLGSRHALTTYHVLLGATLLLLLLGLAMVLSASTIVSYQTLGSPYTLFLRQLLFAGVGLVAMVLASRLPVSFYRRLAYPALAVALVLLVAVLFVGVSVNGQRNWIELGGPFRLQPSEFAKLALVLWIADLLARKQPLLDQWKHLLVPLLPVSVAIVALVLLEGDVGNALVLIPMVAVALFVAGAPLRLFAVGAVAVLTLVAMASMSVGYRMDRFRGWLDPESDPSDLGWQVLHGKSALGGGGWFGVGLGGSREKWGWLPAAHTDFIYAVVGEELGVIGSVLVVVLFAAVAVAGLRVALAARDRFVRVASTMVVAWLLTQAILNLGAVLQLLPITGVPLPLVSYGGSSLVPTLVALGMLMSFARHERRTGRARRPAGSIDLTERRT